MFKKHLFAYRKEVILGPFFKLIEAIFELAIPMLMAKTIDEGIKNQDMKLVLMYIGIMFVLTVLGFLASITCQYYAGVAGYGVGASMRLATYQHISQLNDESFDQMNKHFLINTITSDCEQIQNSVNMAIRLASRAPFLIIGAIVLAFLIHPLMAAIFLGISMTVILFVYTLGRLTVKHYRNSQKELDSLTRMTKEAKTGDKMIRAFSKQKESKEKFAVEADKFYRIQKRIGFINSFLNPVNYLLINIGILLVLYLGSMKVDEGFVTQGQMLALVNYFGQILMSLIILINLVLLFTKGYASYDRIKTVFSFNQKLGLKEEDALETTDLLTVKNMTFSFGEQKNVLENLSFSVSEHGSLGVIGRTGSGKSTIIRLLTRHYDPDYGDIYYRGRNLKSIDPKDLLKEIGVANQKAYLFEGTVRSNLQMANPAITEDEMLECLKRAQATFVLKHPEGLDMHLSQGGLNLSGGQRQRLNIARSLANHPTLLILDDSSSALDFKTDFELRQTLKALKITTIMIAQRVQAIKDCDQIIVLENGKIAGLGTHQDLLKENEFYQSIAAAQGVLS